MSSPAPRCLALGLALALLAPASLRGQQTEESLVQHLDTLVPMMLQAFEESRLAKERADRELDGRVPTETLDIGLLKVLVIPGEEAVARDVVGGVWERDYAAWVDASPSLGRDRMFFQWSNDPVEYKASSFIIRSAQGSLWRSRTYMETGVRENISQSLMGDLVGSTLADEWGIRNVARPASVQRIYRQVATVASQSVRACRQGDDDACLLSFGLIGDGYPMDDWYSAEERQLYVKQNRTRFGGLRVENQDEARRCLDGDLGACDAAVEAYWDRMQGGYPHLPPLTPEVRSSLLWHALNQGGEGAWSRLLAHADDTPLAALEAASGLSGAELVTVWREWLLEGQPPVHAGLGSLALGVLFWTVLLFTLAMRSTRWRLG